MFIWQHEYLRLTYKMYDFPKLHYYQTLSLQALEIEKKKTVNKLLHTQNIAEREKKVRIFLAVHRQVHTYSSCCGMLWVKYDHLLWCCSVGPLYLRIVESTAKKSMNFVKYCPLWKIPWNKYSTYPKIFLCFVRRMHTSHKDWYFPKMVV